MFATLGRAFLVCPDWFLCWKTRWYLRSGSSSHSYYYVLRKTRELLSLMLFMRRKQSCFQLPCFPSETLQRLCIFHLL